MKKIFEFKSATLGVISHKHLWGDPEGIKTTGGFGRQVEELSQYFEKTILVVPFEKRHAPQPGYVIRIKNQEIVPLPYFSSAGIRGKLDLLTKTPLIAWRTWHAYMYCDVVSYWLSGYAGALGLLVHRLRRSRAGFILLGGDWPERIRQQSRDTWLRRLMSSAVEHMLPWLMQGVPIFAVGHLSEKYKQSNSFVHAGVQTTLSARDVADVHNIGLAPQPHLLYVGRLAAEKGLPYLIEAMALCQRDGLTFDLTVVGDGTERGTIEGLVAKHGLENQVRFKGFIPLGPELQKSYRQADIFVLPSLSEGVAKVLIEAMANGLVIIATRVGGIPTIIEDGVNGLLVEPRSPEAIACAIKRILQEPEMWRYLSRNALSSAWKYTIEEHTERLMNQLSEDLYALGWQ
jgi:glycosyltransferase involved in cell wall biosynthesis